VQATVQIEHIPLSSVQLTHVLTQAFGSSLPLVNAWNLSRRFGGGQTTPVPTLVYASNPTTRSLALIFSYPSFVECHVEAGLTGAETIYRACDQATLRLFKALKEDKGRPKLVSLTVEEENAKDVRISAKLPSYWDAVKQRFFTKDVIGKALAFVGISLTGYIMLTKVGNSAIISAGVALLALIGASAIEAGFEYARDKGRLIWEVQR